MFLSFEGVDGCGKSTQLELLRARLENLGCDVVATREPGGTGLAEAIRGFLLDGEQKISPAAELLLFGAARAQHVGEIIRPALERGAIVLSDRFADSSLAYQGGGLHLDADFIAQMNRFATENLQPDLTFFLDLDAQIASARRAAKGNDRIEARGVGFQNRVRQSFQEIAAAQPQRVVTLDANSPAESLHNRIVEILLERNLWPQFVGAKHSRAIYDS